MPDVAVRVHELSLDKLQELYDSIDKEILVEDLVTLPIDGSYCMNGDDWSSVVTSLGGGDLHALYVTHGNRLFSANFRDFMGVYGKKSINAEMKKSAEQSPRNFWVYNNGITILTHKIEKATKRSLTLRGMSIINGAQTTGVLGQVGSENIREVRVPCRIVQCTDQDLIADIISFNNTQNEMKSFDLRSRDVVQKRLRLELDEFAVPYVHRRSASRRLGLSAIHASIVAPALAAFHNEFQVAIRQLSKDL